MRELGHVRVVLRARDRSGDVLGARLSSRAERTSKLPLALIDAFSGTDVREVFRLHRLDLAAGSRPLVEVNLATLPDWPAVEVTTRGGIVVLIEPIVWNGVELAVEGGDASDARLEAWCRAWLDVDDENPPDEDGFTGAIHSMSAPTQADGITTFDIDFGTAPLDAVAHLFDVLERGGAHRVR